VHHLYSKIRKESSGNTSQNDDYRKTVSHPSRGPGRGNTQAAEQLLATQKETENPLKLSR